MQARGYVKSVKKLRRARESSAEELAERSDEAQGANLLPVVVAFDTLRTKHVKARTQCLWETVRCRRIFAVKSSDASCLKQDLLMRADNRVRIVRGRQAAASM